MNYLTPQLDPYNEEIALIVESAQDLFRQSDNEAIDAFSGYRKELWAQMAAMGWLGWASSDELGGIGLSFSAGLALHEAIGAAAAPEPLVEIAILTAGLLAEATQPQYQKQALESLLAGQWLGCFVYKRRLASNPLQRVELQIAKNDSDEHLLNGQVGFAALPDSQAFLVQAGDTDNPTIYWVDANTPGLEIIKTQRVDQRYWADLLFNNVRLNAYHIVLSGQQALTAIQKVKDQARLALSAQMLGAAASVFHKTLQYIKLRTQFDQTISSFQVIQHKSADIAIALELMRACIQEAARVFDNPESSPTNLGYAASRAKASASKLALDIIKQCLQLQGGIAYTEECDLGHYLKLTMVQSASLGNALDNQRKVALWSDTQGHQDLLEKPQWYDEIKAWVNDNLPEKYRFPATRQSWREAHEWHKMLYQKGIVAPAWPKEFGGMGLNPYEELMLYDIYAEFGINTFQIMGITMLGPLLQKYGTKAQQEKYLPGILSGDTYWCQGYSEPEAGSDLASLRTTAVLDDDHFVVNGQKIWTSLAHEADMIFLLARTDPKVKKQKGISFLLLDMNTPGITVEPIVNLTGAKDFCTVFFDNVKVPKENLVGALNNGWGMAKSLLGSERIMIGHPRFAKAAFAYLKEYVRSNHITGFDNELNALTCAILDLESLYVRYLSAIRLGKELNVETSVLKICSSEIWQKTVALFLQIARLDSTINQSINLSENLKVHIPFQFLHALR